MFQMDADYDPSLDDVTRKTKKRNRKSKFAQSLTKKKPVFNPGRYHSWFQCLKINLLDFRICIRIVPPTRHQNALSRMSTASF